jgi:hypothetical protein
VSDDSSSSSDSSWSGDSTSAGSDSGDSGGYGGDTYTETTHKSWFQRLQEAIVGVLIGLVMIAGSVGLLFWNEGRAVTTARSLTEGAGLVVSVPPERVDPANNDKLVHVAGNLTLGGQAADPEFGVSAAAVKLVRKVEMYQWKEESRSEKRTKLGGGEETVTTYHYTRVWSDKYNESSRFKQPGGHHNPPMRFTSRDFLVSKANLGAFDMGPETLRQLHGGEPLPVPAAAEPRARQTAGNMARVIDSQIYVGRDPASPQIGDLRITYETVTANQVSVIGRQAGNGFGTYQTKAGDQLLMVEKGLVPAATMFKHAQDANTVLTWILRGVGALVMFIGFGLFFRPLGVLGDVIPILGDIIRLGTGAISLAMTAVLASITIAIAWLYYRPLVGILVLLVGIGLAVGLWSLGRKRRAARPMAMPGGMVPAGAGGGQFLPPQAPMGQMPPGQWQHPQMPPGQHPQAPPGQWPQQYPPQQGQWPQQPYPPQPYPQQPGQWQGQPQQGYPQQGYPPQQGQPQQGYPPPGGPPQGPVQR